MTKKKGHLWIWGTSLPGFTHVQLWITDDARLVVNQGSLQGKVFRDVFQGERFLSQGTTLPPEEWL